MIKRFAFLLVLIIVFKTLAAQPKGLEYSVFLSMGVSSPASYENSSASIAFIDIASESVSNLGFDLGGVIYYKKIGLNMGLGYYKYVFDTDKYLNDRKINFPGDSISIFMTDKQKDIPLHIGLSYYFNLSNIYIEPRFLVRMNRIIAPKFADVYHWNEDRLVQTTNHLKYHTSRFDLVPSLSIGYFYTVSKELKVGIQATYEYSFSNPQYEYSKKETDILNKTIAEEKLNFNANYSCSKFSFGLIVRFR